MDDLDTEIACILADCASDDDLQRYIIKHAKIVQRLACCMVKELDDEARRDRFVEQVGVLKRKCAIPEYDCFFS